MPAHETIQHAIQLVRAGERAKAREVLKIVLAKDRDNPFAWAAMVQAAENRQEGMFCLKQVLRLRPGDSWATEHLRRLESAPAQPGPAAQDTPVPESRPKTSPQAVFLDAGLPPRPRAPRDQAALPGAPKPALSSQAGSPPKRESRVPQLLPLPGLTPSGRQAPVPTVSVGGVIAPQAAAAGAGRREGVSRTTSLLAAGPLIFVGLAVALVAFLVWYEFFAAHPGDAEKALQAAQEWTAASYRTDYDAMEKLVCGRYASQVREAKQASSFVGIFATALGVDFSSEPPDTLTYEIVSIKGNTARVRVDGFFPEFEALMGDSYSDETVYVMKREIGAWRWCGEE